MTDDLTVAKTIYEQIGGRQFRAMTGASGFLGDANSLMFSIPLAKNDISKVAIILTPADLYDIIFYKHQGGWMSDPLIEVARHDGIFFDQLQDIFEQETGYYTTLHARKQND